jgi:hypothetical protein
MSVTTTTADTTTRITMFSVFTAQQPLHLQSGVRDWIRYQLGLKDCALTMNAMERTFWRAVSEADVLDTNTSDMTSLLSSIVDDVRLVEKLVRFNREELAQVDTHLGARESRRLKIAFYDHGCDQMLRMLGRSLYMPPWWSLEANRQAAKVVNFGKDYGTSLLQKDYAMMGVDYSSLELKTMAMLNLEHKTAPAVEAMKQLGGALSKMGNDPVVKLSSSYKKIIADYKKILE